jgi:hypothetical protein
MTLPLRFRILHLLIITEAGLSEVELMDMLKPEYGAEGQYKRAVIENHLSSMKAIGQVDCTSISLGTDGQLLHRWVATDYGKTYIKYIPKSWKPANT